MKNEHLDEYLFFKFLSCTHYTTSYIEIHVVIYTKFVLTIRVELFFNIQNGKKYHYECGIMMFHVAFFYPLFMFLSGFHSLYDSFNRNTLAFVGVGKLMRNSLTN